MEATEKDTAMQRRVVMARMVKQGEDEKAFNREFWRRVGAQGRWDAMWQMVADADLIRGKHGDQPRLQKSVQRILRREG